MLESGFFEEKANKLAKNLGINGKNIDFC